MEYLRLLLPVDVPIKLKKYRKELKDKGYKIASFVQTDNKPDDTDTKSQYGDFVISGIISKGTSDENPIQIKVYIQNTRSGDITDIGEEVTIEDTRNGDITDSGEKEKVEKIKIFYCNEVNKDLVSIKLVDKFYADLDKIEEDLLYKEVD